MRWAAKLIEYMRERDLTRVEAEPEAEEAWTAEIMRSYEGAMLAQTKSWFTGYNSNVDGHDKLRYMIYLGGSPAYRSRLEEIAERGYEGFKVS